MQSIGRLVFSLLFWTIFVVTSVPGCAVALVIYAAGSAFVRERRERRFMHAFVARWAFSYPRMNPLWDVHVLHAERLPRGPAVLVANHQSMADILVCMGLGHQFKFVAKASLFSAPIIGWALRLAHHVRLERGRVKSMKRMMDECRTWLRLGMPIFIFPEGTYGPSDGRSPLLPFKRGAFVLAVEERVPVVPIALEGTPDLIFEDGPQIGLRARVRMTVLPPIPVEEIGSDPIALARRTRAILQEALGRTADDDAAAAAAADPDATAD